MNTRTYAYAGLTDVFRRGLAVSDAAARLQRLCFVEERLMFAQTAHFVSLPQRDLKSLLARLQFNSGRHVQGLRARLRELRVPKGVFPNGGLLQAPDETLEILMDEALRARGSEEIVAGALFLHRQLCEAYALYLEDTNHLADAPSVDLIRPILAREEEAIRLLEAALADVASSPQQQETAQAFTSLLHEYSCAAGSVDGTTEKGDKIARQRSVEAFAIKHELARDESLGRVWDFVAPPQQEVGAHLAHMMSIRLSEINVAEGLGIVLYETTEKPWGFYFDISRHLWDEVRHSLMGEAAIESTLGDRCALPMRDYEGVYCMEASPLEQYATLGLEVEGANMRYPVGKRGEWEFCREMAHHPLMTTFQDYDWADEVLHVNIARAQLGQWFEGGARALSEFAAQGKQNRTQVKKRHAAVQLPPVPDDVLNR